MLLTVQVVASSIIKPHMFIATCVLSCIPFFPIFFLVFFLIYLTLATWRKWITGENMALAFADFNLSQDL